MPIRKTASFPSQYRDIVDAVNEGLCVRIPFPEQLLADGFRSSFYTYRQCVLRDIKSGVWLDPDGIARASIETISVQVGSKPDGSFEVIFINRDNLPRSQEITRAIEAAKIAGPQDYPTDFNVVVPPRKPRKEKTKINTEDLLDG